RPRLSAQAGDRRAAPGLRGRQLREGSRGGAEGRRGGNRSEGRGGRAGPPDANRTGPAPDLSSRAHGGVASIFDVVVLLAQALGVEPKRGPHGVTSPRRRSSPPAYR